MITPSIEAESLPISYLRQFIFCPRIPWFKYVMVFEPPEQQWVAHGKEWHTLQNSLAKRRIAHDLQPPIEHRQNVYVRSQKLLLHGFVDEVVFGANGCTVIEYKVDWAKPQLGQRLQLLAYVEAVEESYMLPVVNAILLKGSAKKQYKIAIDQAARDLLKHKLTELRQVLSSHRIPFSSASEDKCTQCEYLRYCNDR
jgi:CRISPR-associated exonuclease Cas4